MWKLKQDRDDVTPWILGYKKFFALYSKFRCYPFLSFLHFSFPFIKTIELFCSMLAWALEVSWLLHSCCCIVFLSARSVWNMLIYLVEVSGKFSYFSEYFSIFQNSKSIYLRYLKTFSKVLNMFFEFIGCQIMSRNFPRIFGAFEIFCGY